MEGLPIIRLEIQGMKYQIMHHLSNTNLNLEKIVSEEIDKVMSEEYIKSKIVSEMRSALYNAIEDNFRLGEARTIMNNAISENFKIDKKNKTKGKK